MSVKQYEELALRLYCAYLSSQLGISYEHCKKTYLKDIEPNEYWYTLAEKVASDMANVLKIQNK
ncbi:hypothetical protein H8E88_30725 [candidate division KSB1 bacterium]|nr:hypothetical protein [candidate division KSB1 bacterium]